MNKSYFKKNIAFWFGVLSIISEIFIAKYVPECALSWVQMCILLFVVLLFLILMVVKKGDYILQSFLVALHNHAGSVGGVFMIIYVLIQIHLIGTSFHEYLNGDKVVWQEPLAYLGFLLLPFLLQAFAIEGKTKKVEKEKRRVLVTALSKLFYDDLQKYKENDFDRDKIIAATKSRFWNWTSFNDVIIEYANIDAVIFILDNEQKKQIAQYKANNDGNCILELYLKEIERKYNRSKISKIEIYVDDVNDFNIMYKDVKTVLEGKLSKYEDEQIIFNISSGTSTVTATLVFLSVKGKRGFCYLDQSTDRGTLREFNMNAYNLKELWNEILSIL